MKPHQDFNMKENTEESVRIIKAEIPLVQEIIRREIRLESKKRGIPVSPEDPVIKDHVFEILDKQGKDLIEKAKCRCRAG